MLLYRLQPDELIYIGRLMRGPVTAAQRETAPTFKEAPGSGVLDCF